MIKQLSIPFFVLMLILYMGVYIPELISSYGIKLSHQSLIRINYLFQCSLWLSAAWLLARLIFVFIWEGLLERKPGDKAHKLVRKLITAVIFFIAILGIISIVFKQPVTWIWATIGITIFLGFALQNMILDALTSIAIDLDSPYKVGDWILVHGNNPSENIEGCIIEINLRATRIRTREDNLIVIPNRRLGQLMVTNYMKPDLPSRQTLSFTLDINIPPERVIHTLLTGTRRAIHEMDELLEEPVPQVMVSDMNTSGIKYIVWFWMNGNLAPDVGRDSVMISIIKSLQKAGISTAYPKQYIYHSPIITDRFEDFTADRTELLSRIPLFSSLDKKELNQLSNHLKRRLYKKDQMVVKQGDPGDTMFIVAEGLLNIFSEIEDSSNEDNSNQVKIGQIIGGQFFGEISMLTGQPRSATVITETDTVIYEISKNDIMPLLNQNKSFAEKINKTISERRLQTLQKLANIAKEKRKIEKMQNQNHSKQVLDKMRTYLEVK